ncbi:MAG TPA: tetratricopeptide repeat protein [Anaerolineae bacterium]|nr:tetratricopeptide repeat protein [Anaerolineae bacterium]
MITNLVPTKIMIPRRVSGVVRRSRLIDFLHENLERKLLLVTAPAGYGKTTLLVDFANDLDMPVCWYTLDEGDRDPSTFMAHLVGSIRQRFPRFGERSMSLSESGVLSARAAAAALVADMVNDIPEYFVLIFDDWHLVGEEAAVRDLLDQLLRYIPEHAHLIVAGRTLPRGPLVRLAAQGLVAGLGSNDLRFTTDEVTELLASKYGLQIESEQAAKLIDESEGWITGILLTSHSMWRGLLAGLIHAAGASGTLYDYLAGEVFDHLSAPLRRFLLESAVPRQFTLPMCDELRGVSGSDAWIDQVEARSLFLMRVVADGETWFRYHHLFREFLLARFNRDDPAGLARLHARCGAWFEARQQPEDAVEHYLAAGAPDRAASVMDAHARSLFIAGRTQTLLRWAEILPAEFHSTAPKLMLFQGQALLERGRSAETLLALQQAEAAFRARGDTLGQVQAILLQGWSHYAHGKPRDALATGQEVLKQIGAEDTDGFSLKAQALRLVGISYGQTGQWQMAEGYLVQALALSRRSDTDERHAYNLGRVLQDLAYALRFLGRLEEAATYQAESLAVWRAIGNPGPLAESLNNAGYDRFLAGDYDGALRLYAEALVEVEQVGDKRTQAWILDSIATVRRDRGEFEPAIAVYEEVLEIAKEIGEQSLISWALDGVGHAHRLANNLDRALALFEQARSLAEHEGTTLQVTLSTASIGIAKVEQGDVRGGIVELEQATGSLRMTDSYVDLARTLFWLTRAYYLAGQQLLAKEHLAEGVRLGARLGRRPFSLAEGRHVLPFLFWSAQQLDSNSQLQAWLEQLRVAVAAPVIEPVSEPLVIPRIEVRAFGPGHVFRDSRLLSVQEWGGSAIARELLFYLLDRPPQRKEEIGAMFWPNLSPGKMTSAFHAAKYRARRALGVEFVIYQDDTYQVNPAAAIWYDVAEFERLLDTVQHRSRDDPDRMTELQRAIDLYSGEYLSGVYADWVTERRQILQTRYFDALNQLLDALLRQRHYEQALELCQRGIEFDYYREDLHRGLMRSLAETGRRAEALMHYKALARRLRKDLRASPAPATRDLFVRIRS